MQSILITLKVYWRFDFASAIEDSRLKAVCFQAGRLAVVCAVH